MGLTLFGHDFGSLKGNKPAILESLQFFLKKEVSFFTLLLNGLMPFLMTFTKSNAYFEELRDCIRDVTKSSMERTKKEKEFENSQGFHDKSLLSILSELYHHL